MLELNFYIWYKAVS